MYLERAVHLIGGLMVLTAVSLPSLTNLQLDAEVVECHMRRSTEITKSWWSDRVCPRDQSPYLYRVSDDSTVITQCPNGHGEDTLPMHVWVRIDASQQGLF